MAAYQTPPDIEIRLRRLDVMDRITQISIAGDNMQDVLRGVLDLVLEAFSADRAWFLYPCDPDAPTWSVPMERTRPEWPGLYKQDVDMPMDSNMSGVFGELLGTNGTIEYGPDTDHPVPPISAQMFSVKSQLNIALRPKIGKGWVFGLHHCASAVKYDESEVQLFTSIAFRISDILSGLLSIQQLRESEGRIQELADIAVQESERHLREAQSIAHIGSWDYDLATGKLEWSDELYRIYGVSPDIFAPNIENQNNLIHPDDQAAMKAWMEACASGQKPVAREFRCVRSDGTIRYLEGQGGLFPGADGKPGHLSGTAHDITERKQLERGFKLAQYSVDHAQDAIFRLNHNAQFLYVNDAACRHLGYSRDELLKKSLFDINPDFSPEDWAAHWKKVSKAGSKRFETRHKRQDGTLVPVEVVANCIELEGELIFTSIVRNIADRKQAEMTLLQHKAAIDTTHDGFWINDELGVILEANQAYAEMSGYSVDELRGMHVSQLEAREQSLDEVRAHIEKVVSQGWDVFETRHRRKDGDEIEVETSVSFIPDSRQIVAFFRDITERKEAEALQRELLQQLEAKELAKTRFLAAAGHDLRQPLTAASLYIDTLRLTELTPQQNKVIQRLSLSMDTFKGLLDALLNISRLDSGMIRPEYTSINVSELINGLEQVFAPVASEKSLGLRMYFPIKEALVVRSDNALVKSVLMNLVANAIKYTSKGAVLISARRRGSNALFQVWDTGMGIPGDQVEHIFDEFYQINNPQRDRTGGLGLGLSISKRAITLLGGKIACRSRVGYGSVFGFLVPLASASSGGVHQDVSVALQENIADVSYLQGKRFVVVEDDTLVAQAIGSALEGIGGEVSCFHKAADALHHANIGHADYFIVDYMLGGELNGIQFLNQLRQKLGRPIRATLVTGETSAALVRETACLDWPVLYKPVNLANLIAILGAQAR